MERSRLAGRRLPPSTNTSINWGRMVGSWLAWAVDIKRRCPPISNDARVSAPAGKIPASDLRKRERTSEAVHQPDRLGGEKMVKVYRDFVGPDDYVGRVEEDGRVYGQRFGPDEYLGRVEPSGRVYAHLAGGPDRYLGRVEHNGRIYRHIAGGLDEEVGRVEDSGRIYARRPGLAPDDLLGRVEEAPSVLAGGAAFFLLLGGLGQEKSD
jgi:hypothetical protein